MFRHIFVHFALITLLFGCATVTRGTKEALIVETSPSNAKVMLSSGQSCASTPCTFKVERRMDLTVTVMKDGCKTKKTRVVSTVSGNGGVAVAGNAVVGGLVGLGVDSMTGAAKSLTPNPVKVDLSC